MPSDSPEALFSSLERDILARDQVAASETYYKLFEAETPLEDLLREATRIHAPYTHVPFHERIADGYIHFVNNDHCLLSSRAALHLSDMLPGALCGLPMAQTVWYIPTGLDIWNQKRLKAPGHYARDYAGSGKPPAPIVHWDDQSPNPIKGRYQAAIEQWMTHVHRGEVIEAYRQFLGLMENREKRARALNQLVFAGLMNVQDRVVWNRWQSTGHKGYRARATVELGRAIGWDDAHDVLYAGALDLAVGPHGYSTYESACNLIDQLINEEGLRAPDTENAEREVALWSNEAVLERDQVAGLREALLHGDEVACATLIADYLSAGASLRSILETIQIASADVLIQTKGSTNFSSPQHCYEYANTVGWYFDNFEHNQRLKLLFMASAVVCRNVAHQHAIGEPLDHALPASPNGVEKMSTEKKLAELDRALLTLDSEGSLAWTSACLDEDVERGDLIETIATAATKIGNDPHNQEIALCLIEDFQRTDSPHRDRLLLAAAQHTATHQKYDDHLECYHRYCTAMSIPPSV